MSDNSLGIRNELTLREGLILGGQPDRAALERAKELGITRVINLRAENEAGVAEEIPIVEELGMEYIAIPMSGAAGLTEENARRLDEALTDAPTLLHCGSGNRVGGLLALRAFYVDGATPEEAMEIGRSSGLTGLEPHVASHLEEACENDPEHAGCE